MGIGPGGEEFEHQFKEVKKARAVTTFEAYNPDVQKIAEL